MANTNSDTYESIDRPYDSYLTRASTNEQNVDIPDGSVSGSGNGGTATDSGGTENSVTESDKTIVAGEQIGDIFLENIMQSTNYLPKARGFIIDAQKGYIEASDVYLVGTITASAGYIASFVIESDYIRDAANSFGLSATVTSGDDIRLWAGDTYANRATADVRLTESGVLSLGSGTPYLVLDGPNAQIGTSTFVSGQTGWRIEAGGTAEFNNVIARGLIRTAVFQKDTISSVGGSFLVVDSDVLDADMTALDASTLTITGDTTFANNDILRIKDGTDDEWLKVTDASGAPTYVVARDQAGDYAADTNPVWTAGVTVVNYGQTTEGFVLMTSSLANSPYVDIGVTGATPWSGTTPKARMGNLAGITSATFGALSGYGLWTENGYFEGQIGGTTITGGTIQTATSGQRIRIVASAATSPTQIANSFFLIDSSDNVMVNIGGTGANSVLGTFSIPDGSAQTLSLQVLKANNDAARCFVINHSHASATGTACDITQAGLGKGIYINPSNSSSTAIGIHLDYDAAGVGFQINIDNTSHNSYAQYIQNQGQGYSLYIQHVPPTTTGTYCAYFQNAADVAIETLRVQATGSGNTAAPLYLQTGDFVSTNFKKLIRGNAVTIWESDGTSPHTVLSGTAGDICVNADSGQSYYCSGGTTWVAM